jgi:hypothetical protein
MMGPTRSCLRLFKQLSLSCHAQTRAHHTAGLVRISPHLYPQFTRSASCTSSGPPTVAQVRLDRHRVPRSYGLTLARPVSWLIKVVGEPMKIGRERITAKQP